MSYKIQSKTVFPTRREFLNFYCTQSFSFPNSIMYFITMNPPTSELYQKLIHSCRYFFIKNPILILSNFILKTKYFPKICCSKTSTKLWIVKDFRVPPSTFAYGSYQFLFSMIFPKLYKLDINHLFLTNLSLTFDEFLFLSSTVKLFCLKNISIKYSNEKEVEFEKVIEALPKAEHFHYTFSSHPSNISFITVTELIKIPHFSSLKLISLSNIPEAFDINILVEFLKSTNLKMQLSFFESLPADLAILENKILQLKDFTREVPLLFIPRIEDEIQRTVFLKRSRER